MLTNALFNDIILLVYGTQKNLCRLIYDIVHLNRITWHSIEKHQSRKENIMKRRILAIVLTLACVLSLSVSTFASDAKLKQGALSTSELKYWIDTASASSSKEITVPYSVSVTSDTVIPAGVTVNMADGTILSLYSNLTVNGKLNIGGWLYMTPTGRIDPAGKGKAVYSAFDHFITGNPGYNLSAVYPWYGQYPTDGHIYVVNFDGTKQDYHSYEYYIDGKKYEVSIPWWYYYPEKGTPTVVPYYTYSSYVCPIHHVYYTLCKECGVYYCPSCQQHTSHVKPSNNPTTPGTVVTLPTGTTMTYEEYLKYLYNNYNYNYYNGYYNPWNWDFTRYSDFVDYLNSGYYRDWYANYVYTYFRAKPAVANVKSGAVQSGTKVTLTTETAGGTIYYTTNGTTPDVGSIRYTGPITITKNTTLKTVVVYGNYIASEIKTYTYTVTAAAQFNDVSKYDGLALSLSKLISAGIIVNSDKFEPDGTFTYDELVAMLTSCGIDMTKVNILNEDTIRAAGAMTYNDFVYVTYKALRSIDRILPPQTSGTETIKELRNYKNVTNAAIYRSAFISFIENGLLYDLEFDPTAPAARYQLATVLANIVK